MWQGLWEGWVKQSVRAIGHLVLQAINPVSWWETVETWWQAVQDWRAGKRGLWDVLFTTANVAALGLGLYMGGQALYRQVAPRLQAAGTVVEMESRAAGAVVVGEGVSDEAARLAAQYGDEAARLAAQYSDDVLRLVEQYGDEGLWLVETYGDDALWVWTRYGHEGLQVLEVHGRPAVALLDDFGEQALEVLCRAVPDTSRSWKDFIPKNYQKKVEGAFDGPGYAVRLQEDLIVYRYWGDDLGTNLWFTTNPNLTPAEARALLALPKHNTAIHVTEFRIPKGTTIIIGKVASKVDDPIFGPYAKGEVFKFIFLSQI